MAVQKVDVYVVLCAISHCRQSGFVVSDWGATHSTSAAINAGLDIDMPDNKYFNQASIKAAIAVGNISQTQVHDSCIDSVQFECIALAVSPVSL